MVGLTKNVNQATTWEAEDPENRWHGRHGEEVPIILPKPINEVDSLNPNFDSIEKTSEESMPKKVKVDNLKKPVIKHLKEDIKESKKSIKEDKKLTKKMKKGGC